MYNIYPVEFDRTILQNNPELQGAFLKKYQDGYANHISWLDKSVGIHANLQHLAPSPASFEESDMSIRVISDIVKALEPQKINSTSGFTLGSDGQPFQYQPTFAIPFGFGKKSAYTDLLPVLCVSPTGEQAPAYPGFLFESARAHGKCVEYYLRLFGAQHQHPPPLTIFAQLPDNLRYNGVEVNKYFGWAKDFGPGNYATSMALKGLPSAPETHFLHEGWHGYLEYTMPEMYFNLLNFHPSLNEGLAIAASISQNIYKPNYNFYRDSFGGLGHGLEGSYLFQKTMDNMNNPSDFNQLDGGGVFKSSLYHERMNLGIFLLALAGGNVGSKRKIEHDPPPLNTPQGIGHQLSRGIRHFQDVQNSHALTSDGRMYYDYPLLEIHKSLAHLQQKVVAGYKINPEDFYASLINGVEKYEEMTGNEVRQSYRMLEQAYLNHSESILTTFLILHNLRMGDFSVAEILYENISPTIMARAPFKDMLLNPEALNDSDIIEAVTESLLS